MDPWQNSPQWHFPLKKKKIISFTILQCPDHLHLAVSPLELIKEGAHFELVDGASLQLTDHHPVFPRGVYLHDPPLALWLPVISRWPVKHLVTLNVWRPLLHLVERQMPQQLVKISVFHYTITHPIYFCDTELSRGTICYKKNTFKTFFLICEFLTVNHNIWGLLIVSSKHSCG